MKHALLLSVLGIGLLSSCSTAFKAGQTPDDVYYSPGRSIASAKEEENLQKENGQYQEYISSLDDRYLRMKIANRSRWSTIDNFDYWYDSRYDFSTYNYYNGLNPYSAWNPGWSLSIGYGRYCYGGSAWGWYSPIYTVVGYTIPHYYYGGGSTSGSNISAFRNKVYNNNNSSYNTYNPKSSGSSFGSLVRKVFTGSESNGSYDRPARTFAPSSNSSTPATSSSAGGSSGGFHSTGSSASTGRGGRG
jgi:hypothetical protein